MGLRFDFLLFINHIAGRGNEHNGSNKRHAINLLIVS